jgi:hypothetical protein
VDVRQRVERYLRTSGVAPSRFGRVAVGDPGFVTDMRNGRELRARTVARVQAFLDAVENGDAEDKPHIVRPG